MENWYHTNLGKLLLSAELSELSRCLQSLFGYYILQIGGPMESNPVLPYSPIHNKLLLNPATKNIGTAIAIQSKIDDLPFLPESLDAVLAMHILETTRSPKRLIKEFYDTLIPGGCLVIVGFNPYSLWGLSKFILKNTGSIWQTNWHSYTKLRSWLNTAGFSIESYKTLYYQPPANNIKSKMLEILGKSLWPSLGASYICVAKKTLFATNQILEPRKTPIKSTSMLKGLTKPTTRARLD